MGSELAEPPRSRPVRRGRVVTWVVVALVLVVAAIVGWIGVRGVLARQELSAALPAAQAVKADLLSGDLSGARTSAAELRRHADAAASLTGDPVWRAAEVIPWAGANLAAVRTASAAVDTVAAQVIEPLVRVAGTADPRSIAVHDGRIDLAPIVAAQPVAERAQAAYHRAQASVAGIDASATIQPVREAVVRLDDLLTSTAPAVDAVGNTARLLPPMLGADGPRTYLVVAQNPAELRATGGLIGSVAVVRADRGAISLAGQAAGTSIGPWEQPVADIPAGTQGLYGPLVGRYLQDANLTPDFPLAASTVATMWTKSHGGTVDGVVAMDPVVLSALLKATGPVTLPTGESMGPAEVVPLLLSQAYARYPDAAQQDAFFSSAAAAVFAKVASGGADGSALVDALAKSGTSRRILLWSSHADEQRVLATTTLAGGLPVSTKETAGYGVYFDDATGAKMDYYLSTRVEAGTAVCRADGKPTTRLSVTLTNRAPADAAASLPHYVTGYGIFGVQAGSIRTRVAVYGPSGGLLAGTQSGGADYPTVPGTDDGRPVSLFTVQLAPGQSKTVDVEFVDTAKPDTAALGAGKKARELSVAVTPTLPGDGSTPDVGAEPPVSVVALDCASTIK